MKKICFIGACGHTKQAYRVLRGREDVILCGFSPYSADENVCSSFIPDLLTEFLDGKEPIPPDEIFYITKIALLARDSADCGKTLCLE